MVRIFSFFLLLLPLCGFTQVITVSEEIPLRTDVAYDIIGQFKDRLLLFRNQTTKFEVQAFNKNMKESWNKEIDLDKRLPVVMDISSSPDYFSILYRFRRKNQVILKAHKYDPAANLIDSAAIKDYGYLFYTPDFEILHSQDRKKLLIYYIERQTEFHALSFDLDSMKVLWEKTFVPEGFELSRDLHHTVVDNEGNFYLIFEKNNLRYKKEPHYYEVHQFMGSNAGYHRYNIALESKLTYDVFFTFDNANQCLKAGGLYSDSNPGRSSGYFFLNVPQRNIQEQKLVFHAYDPEFIANLMGKEVEDNKGIMECSIQDVVLRQDGGLLIIGERNRQYERRTAANNRMIYDNYARYIVDYFYDDLFILAFHPDGQPHWNQVLHKKQYSQDDSGAFSSFFLFKTAKKLHFLFNDEIRTENTISEYVIDGAGDFKRNSVLSTENLKIRLRFRDALQLDARHVVIPSERRSNLRLVMLEY